MSSRQSLVRWSGRVRGLKSYFSFFWEKGGLTVSISYMSTPMLQQSILLSQRFLSATSGDMQSRVPQRVLLWTLVLMDQPKSVIFSSQPKQITFSGLRSLWMIPLRCKYSTPARIWVMYLAVFSSGKGPLLSISSQRLQQPYSMTRQTQSLPTWQPWAGRMLGWRQQRWIFIQSMRQSTLTLSLRKVLMATSIPLTLDLARIMSPVWLFPSFFSIFSSYLGLPCICCFCSAIFFRVLFISSSLFAPSLLKYFPGIMAGDFDDMDLSLLLTSSMFLLVWWSVFSSSFWYRSLWYLQAGDSCRLRGLLESILSLILVELGWSTCRGLCFLQALRAMFFLWQLMTSMVLLCWPALIFLARRELCSLVWLLWG